MKRSNGIGLSSPFLEWKLLLRGLIAWSANDTPRALENWSRLSPDRLPARLAAPFRLTADKAYAATLPADRVAARRPRRPTNSPAGSPRSFRKLRKQLANEDTIPAALETARVLVPELKRVAPDLVPRLANVVYWALISGGQPEDLPRYNRVFGPPADDPQFYRLQALVMEQMRRLDMAHGMWGKYEEWIAKTPARWPGAAAGAGAGPGPGADGPHRPRLAERRGGRRVRRVRRDLRVLVAGTAAAVVALSRLPRVAVRELQPDPL